MIEEWKVKLDNDNIVGAILMDLSKAFDCIPHDLLIAKLHAYGFDENALVLIYSYLKRRKQSVRINDTYSSFQTILSGVPQGSVLSHLSKPAGITTWRETWKKIFTLFFRCARFLIGLQKVAWHINWLPKSSFAPTGKGYDVISVLGVALPDGRGQLPALQAHFGGRGLLPHPSPSHSPL